MPTTPVLSRKHTTYARANGHRATVAPDRAAAHIHQLRCANLIDQQITAAARISAATLYRAAGRQGPITRLTERRILAVPLPVAAPRTVSAAHVPPHGTRRRLQALVYAKWPPKVLADRLEWRYDVLHRLLRRERDQVEIGTDMAVRALFRELWDQQPEQHGIRPIAAHRARQLADRHGWQPALAWDDIDAPGAVPDLGREISRVQAVVEDTAELVAEGLSREGIAVRLGIGWDAVRQAHRRAGRPVPVILE